MTIINIYATRFSNERAPIWKKLSETSFTADHIILGGDFNHLEETDYRGIVEECQIHRRKTATWHHITLQYGLSDAWNLNSFRKMTEKKFTFHNRRSAQAWPSPALINS
jgi:hypothetical protein